MLNLADVVHLSASPALEHVLGKDDPKKMSTLTAIGPFFVLLFAVWLFYYFRKDRFKEHSPAYIVLAGFTFSVTSVSMHTLNKAVVSFTHQPAIVTSIQMFIAVVVIFSWSWREVLKADRLQLMKWCIVPAAYAAMLNSSLLGYEYLSLTLVTVFRNLAPLVTMAVETVIMPPEHRPKVSAPIVGSILLMIVGAMLFSWAETAFSWFGVGLIVLNTLLCIADRVLQRRLLIAECKDLPLNACMVVNNGLGIIPTLCFAYVSREVDVFEESAVNWRDPGIIVLVIMSGFMGLFIGLSGLMCQKVMSATSFQVLQNMSKVVVVAMGVTIFGDKMNDPSRILGMLLSLGGSLAYGYARTMEDPDAKTEELKALMKEEGELKRARDSRA